MFIGEKKIARPFRWGIVGGGRTSGVGYKHRLGAMRDNTSFVLKAAAFAVRKRYHIGVRLLSVPDARAMRGSMRL